ncbi:MAG: hypothetical protein A2504_04805 [Bdellovibrionales bacterium RIFOXYD12_FULL_39_22]|nr:MAG: hypothetical protein A2385_07020 [Bdellovibrionales bacterium RIFOXYB1_FULL_39_21]OFZ42014.1 MAG: hypothetical protein A2485_08990 [Bdellovibrionales bacterium RIFOXYC12_FULL_39_17]OFZ50730.1 MAG: hypothetical protein A2404_05940 [Bdellovibrionales bacterium RIFOXYC1_FULL_39_130]OFZ69498.1 MAG: hypothetical protein A2451_02455 [Bdellovibrionales bacterium RIFOXYC2_FULL_39_8]OFZ77953.1 MAG: hypothetical protein A2560_01110 [Bdellovibrionales bacterium RIFOXYD1_FULL_39_84]OFZ93611.1 MAG:
MEEYIRGYYPGPKGISLVDIFGYSAKGLPGLEIIGLGQSGKFIKEKILYICKSNGLKFQLKRYVICVDRDVEVKDKNKILWLELPILILFLTLTGHLRIKKLHQFMSSGRIYLDNKVAVLLFDGRGEKLVQGEKKILFCGECPVREEAEAKMISLEELLGPICPFRYESISTREILQESMGGELTIFA